jgi:hypothetical protein
VAINLRAVLTTGWWERTPTGWQFAVWLLLFLLMSRVLYLPWSQTIAASRQNVFEVPPNTSVVLEGVGQGDATLLTLEFAAFTRVKMTSPSATLASRTRSLLASMGAPVPDGPSTSFTWTVRLPREAERAGLLRIEFVPAEGADLEVGTRDGKLQLQSAASLAVNPVAQDYDAISGSLKLGGLAITSAPDLIPAFVAGPGDDAARAHVEIAFEPDDLEFLLGDPFEDEDRVAVRSVALLDESGQLVRRICGAPTGRILLWSTLFQWRLEPQPPARKCMADYLTASGLRYEDRTLVLGLRGSGYVPGMSQWLEKLKGNIVLWPIIAALIAIPGSRLWKSATALLERRAPVQEHPRKE